MVALIIVLATLATAFISSILGMVGGLILMGVLVLLLPVSQAMVLHGIIQLTSNGYRAYLNRNNIQWRLFIGFTLGGVAAMALLIWVSYSPDRAIVFLLLGALPFIATSLPKQFALDITRPGLSIPAGFVVVVTNLLAGVGGPLLDIFFQRVPLTRHQVVATKAVAQSFGHLSKIIFYGGLIGTSPGPFSLLGFCIIASVIGTTLGKKILDRMEDQNFFTWTLRVMLTVGAIFILRGLWMIWTQNTPS